jgi:hypothetical protein
VARMGWALERIERAGIDIDRSLIDESECGQIFLASAM